VGDVLTFEVFCSYATDMVTEAVGHIDVSLCQSPLAKRLIGTSSGMQAGCLLICGASGMGKTTFSSALCHFAASAPRHAYIQHISCIRLCGTLFYYNIRLINCRYICLRNRLIINT
jgi:hypothetical protein